MDWGWLDRAIDTLGAAGLKVVLGTPTATPPRWMLDRHPDMLALDAQGRPRGFGSRRHYCFCASRLPGRMRADRDAAGGTLWPRTHHVAAWQTDNEYGCHDTTLSYSDAARDRVPRLAGAEVPVAAGAEPGLGQCVLVDGLRRLRRDRPAEPDRDRAEPRRM